jgi:hypothetical protein
MCIKMDISAYILDPGNSAQNLLFVKNIFLTEMHFGEIPKIKVRELLQFAVEFTSLQKNQQLQQEDVSHYGEEDLVNQSAVHQPEEPYSRPLSCSETEER